MRILLVEDALSPTRGGVERITYTLFSGLKEMGHDCFIYYRRVDDECIPPTFKYCENQSNITKQFLSCLNKWSIELIICQNLDDRLYREAYKTVKENRKVKLITVLHSNPDIWVNKNRWGHTSCKVFCKELLRSFYFRLIKNSYVESQREMYDLSDKYVLLSDSFKSVFCDLNGVDGTKLASIGNPCIFSDAITSCKKDNTVLVVARMAEQQKRISEVLKVWKRVQRKNWKLQIIGDGPDLCYYKRMSSNLKLYNIEFLGNQEHPEEFYKRAKIFLMTSIWEGFGMTLVEAQHYECVPIVYDSYAAVHDIINSGTNGIIIPLHDINRYVKELTKLMEDECLLVKMAINARESSSDDFSLNTYLQKWNNLIRSL